MKRRTYYYSVDKKEDFSSVMIRDSRPLKKDFRFLTKNPFRKAFSWFFYYVVAVPVLYVYTKLRFHIRVEGARNVRKEMKGTGYFIYANHTNIADAFNEQIYTVYPKKGYIVSQTDTITKNWLLGRIVMDLGALPLPTDLHTAKSFLDALKVILEKKDAVIIYPEATIWPYYTGQRPPRRGSFKYPRTFNKPVVFACTTYKEPFGLFKKHKAPRIVIHLSEPVYPSRDQTVKMDEKRLESLYIAFIEKWSSSKDNYVTNRFILDDSKASYPLKEDDYLEKNYDMVEEEYYSKSR